MSIDEVNEVWKDIETIPYHQAAWPCGNSKLTESAIIDIKSRPDSWGVVRQLAIEYNVNPPAISRIRSGKRWKHIDVGG